MAQIKGTVTRVFEEHGRTYIDVRPADPEELRHIDGSDRLASGDIRQEADGDYEVGDEATVEVKSAKDDEHEGPRARKGGGKRKAAEDEGGANG